MHIQDKVVLITGGKRIGASVAAELAARGADIALSFGTSKAEAEEIASAVRVAGRSAFTRQADLRRASDCAGLVADTVAALGRIDVLITMASIYRRVPFHDLTEKDWDDNIDVDLKSAFLCAHAAVPHMKKVGGGRIITFADWLPASGRPRYEGYLPYYVAKSAVIALTEALALELASDQILVNAIAPGPILAPPETTDDELKSVEKATPLGRWGGGIAIAHAVVDLIEADFITGETIRVDGGRHLK
ncbi:MAG TPA: SDR family oxidoreductase [Vicinamibacterales bacterium]|jgi:NAD(P)-dependent dehydrogenase (short-subunit alcohol dehydrogenase family)